MTSKRNLFWMGLGLFLLVMLLYGRTASFDFVNYDDNNYFYENPQVTQGLTAENIRWAFEIHGPSMWVPLTWLSHQTAVTLFGTSPAPHHLINALLHAANVWLFFMLLRRLTGHALGAVMGALLFAVQPVHVESVAWITERKDVLAGFFWLLTLLGYHRYVRHGRWYDYLWVLAGTILSVMAKPLAVTLPCVLFLLDFWPYHRRFSWRILLEKVPLFIFIGFASWMTMRCQLSIGAVGSAETYPLLGRLANAVTSYGMYLVHLIWPAGLTVFYPYPAQMNWLKAGLSFVLLGLVSGWIFWRRKKSPWAVVGWCWYLGVLFPMIGMVQAGSQAMADRYLYIPALGIYLMIAMWCSTPKRIWMATAVVLFLAVFNVKQVAVWENSRTLFSHALKVSDKNYLAENNLGLTYRNEQNFERARAHFEQSLAYLPSYVEARNNLGITLADLGETEAAIEQLKGVVLNYPTHVEGLYNLGTAWLNKGDAIVAEQCFRKATALEPQNVEVLYNLGYALLDQHRWKEAGRVFGRLLELDPTHADSLLNMDYIKEQQSEAWSRYETGNELRKKDDLHAAVTAYRQALAIDPSFPEVHNNLGVTLGRMGDAEGALYHFEVALRLAPDYQDARTNVERAKQVIDPTGAPEF